MKHDCDGNNAVILEVKTFHPAASSLRYFSTSYQSPSDKVLQCAGSFEFDETESDIWAGLKVYLFNELFVSSR